MAISDKAKNTIQTASSGIEAPKQKVETGGNWRKWRGSCFKKKSD